MLIHLSIRNIALIESLELPWGEGLCVLTGETGAGKSILLDSVGFVLGERSTAKMLRHGTTTGSVTAEFDIHDYPALLALLEEHAIETDGTLFLRRVLYADGKTKAFVNDQSVSVTLLKQLGTMLIEIHGQSEQSTLLYSASHLSILDQYGQYQPLLVKVAARFREWQELVQAQHELEAQQEAMLREEEYIRHAAEELSTLQPEKDEEERLMEERIYLANREKLVRSLEAALHELVTKHPVIGALRTAERHIMRMQHVPPELDLQAILGGLDRASVEAEEVIRQLEITLLNAKQQGGALERIEERLFALRQAARKYRCQPYELPRLQQEFTEKLHLLSQQSHMLSSLADQVAEAEQAYLKTAKELSTTRQETAHKLAAAIQKELLHVRMEKTVFTVQVTPLELTSASETGCDKVIFLASTNPGQPLAPLAEIASGGELSRFMLAVKVVLAHTASAPTLIFDEIDTGIGGATADAVGKRLSLLGSSLQVLVVTHQPQVAAYGHYHYLVSKENSDNQVQTTVRQIFEEERTEEMARMLAGEQVTDSARAAAHSLLEDVKIKVLQEQN